MENDALFGTTIQTAAKAIDLRAKKHQVTLSNIANADTPNYKAFDLLVDEAMAKQRSGKVQLQRTSSTHLPSDRSQSVQPKLQKIDLSSKVTLRGDGNTVDMDREMTAMAANQLMYKASTQILSSKFKGLRDVIKGGAQ